MSSCVYWIWGLHVLHFCLRVLDLASDGVCVYSLLGSRALAAAPRVLDLVPDVVLRVLDLGAACIKFRLVCIRLGIGCRPVCIGFGVCVY